MENFITLPKYSVNSFEYVTQNIEISIVKNILYNCGISIKWF